MKANLTRACGLLLTAALLLTSMAACSKPAEDASSSPASGLTSAPSGDASIDDIFSESSEPAGSASSDASAAPDSSSHSTTTSKNPSGQTPTTKPDTSTSSSDYYVRSTGKVYQNMSFTYEQLPAAYTVNNAYGVQNLGLMQLEEYPIDGVYDNAFNILYVDGVYKMWWCRACPFDTIWYAESKDLKNWYNAQCIIDLKDYQTEYVKEMMSWPSVLYVDGKYHMFFEAPAKIAESGEYSNNIFYASSKNGIDWTFYPNNKDPQPVIVNPNVKEGVYGVGQPKAFYKDGYFYVCYTDASSSGGDIRIARSKGNGFSFEGTVSTHTKLISSVAGAAIRYNQANNKYYMVFTMSSTQSDNKYNDNIYMMESSDLYKWPCTTRAQALKNAACLSNTKDVTKKSNVDFVTNEYGIVTDENMFMVYMNGVMPSENEDHRNTHTTWDGKLAVVTAGSKYNKGFTLPNGKTASAANLKWYYDQAAAWKRPSITGAKGTPAIDGAKDSVYNSGTEALLETVTWSYEDCKPTKTTGSVRTAWDADALYVYAEVKDATGVHTDAVIDKPGNLWRNDSIVVFVDVPNTLTGTTNHETLTPLSYMVILDASGKWIVKDSGENDMSSDFQGLTVSTKKTSSGYVIEAKIPWYSAVKSQIAAGKKIGIDFSINDNFGTDGDREAQVYWSDYAGDSFLYLDRYGELTLK